MVSAGFYPYLVGGAERQALELSAALARGGLGVTVLTRRLPGLLPEEEVRGVQVRRLWRCGQGALDSVTFMASLFFWLLLHLRSYSVIHVHLAGSPALAAAAAGRLLGKKVIVKLGGGRGIGELAVSSQSSFGRLKLRLLACLRPQFVAVARELAEEAAAYLGPVAVHALPNGVDTARFAPVSPARKAELRQKLGWPRGLAFLYAGRFSIEKRLPLFVEVWAEAVRRSNKEAFFVCIGEGPEQPLILRAAERARAQGRVIFSAPVEDLSDAYGGADVFVLPSISEGLSNALLEAMSCGLAVLASEVGGTAEAVEDAKSGLLFPAVDAAALRRQLDKLLSHPELAATLGAAARRRAEDRYSLSSVVARYQGLYGLDIAASSGKTIE